MYLSCLFPFSAATQLLRRNGTARGIHRKRIAGLPPLMEQVHLLFPLLPLRLPACVFLDGST